MAPWQNGRIERFFGTFKERIREWIAAGGDTEKLYQELDVFRCWYNHIRPHQGIDGLTPSEAWDGLEEPRSEGNQSSSRNGMESSPAFGSGEAGGELRKGANAVSTGGACSSPSLRWPRIKICASTIRKLTNRR